MVVAGLRQYAAYEASTASSFACCLHYYGTWVPLQQSQSSCSILRGNCYNTQPSTRQICPAACCNYLVILIRILLFIFGQKFKCGVIVQLFDHDLNTIPHPHKSCNESKSMVLNSNYVLILFGGIIIINLCRGNMMKYDRNSSFEILIGKCSSLIRSSLLRILKHRQMQVAKKKETPAKNIKRKTSITQRFRPRPWKIERRPLIYFFGNLRPFQKKIIQ